VEVSESAQEGVDPWISKSFSDIGSLSLRKKMKREKEDLRCSSSDREAGGTGGGGVA